jgi:hypothetical protein
LEAPYPKGWELDLMQSSEDTFDSAIKYN